MRSGDFAEELAAKSQWTGQGSYTPICLLSSFMNLSNPTEAFEASLRPWVEELNEEMMCVQRREEEIITEGSARSSGESRVFEQRTSSPVVQSCKRVDTSQEGKPQTSVMFSYWRIITLKYTQISIKTVLYLLHNEYSIFVFTLQVSSSITCQISLSLQFLNV